MDYGQWDTFSLRREPLEIVWEAWTTLYFRGHSLGAAEFNLNVTISLSCDCDLWGKKKKKIDSITALDD